MASNLTFIFGRNGNILDLLNTIVRFRLKFTEGGQLPARMYSQRDRENTARETEGRWVPGVEPGHATGKSKEELQRRITGS